MDNSFSSFAIWESGRKKPSIITTINLGLFSFFKRSAIKKYILYNRYK
jgi:hypothetical protein